jgi:hypothetical protein
MPLGHPDNRDGALASPSHEAMHASASAVLRAPPGPAPRLTAIWRPVAFMNRRLA